VRRRILVAPHPDDEGQALGVLENADSVAAVVVLTHGESTGRTPPETPLGARTVHEVIRRAGGSPVAASRIAAWMTFLDDVLGPADTRPQPLAGGIAWRGSGPVRVALGLGDGTLESDAIAAAVARVLDETGPGGPFDLVLCGYEAPDYRHPDHRALCDAAGTLADRPDVRAVLVRSADGPHEVAASRGFYDRLMARDGSFQRCFGWLAPDREAWRTGEGPSGLFPRRAAFRVVPGRGG